MYLIKRFIYIQVDKVGSVKLRQEKEKLERQQQEGEMGQLKPQLVCFYANISELFLLVYEKC